MEAKHTPGPDYYPATIPTPSEAERARRNINRGGVPYHVQLSIRRNNGTIENSSVLVFASCPMAARCKVNDAVKVANDAYYRAYGPKIGLLVAAYAVVDHPELTRRA